MSLGGFVGGTTAGLAAGGFIASLTLTGLPLIGGAMVVAGAGAAGSVAIRFLSRKLYEVAN